MKSTTTFSQSRLGDTDNNFFWSVERQTRFGFGSIALGRLSAGFDPTQRTQRNKRIGRNGSFYPCVLASTSAAFIAFVAYRPTSFLAFTAFIAFVACVLSCVRCVRCLGWKIRSSKSANHRGYISIEIATTKTSVCHSSSRVVLFCCRNLGRVAWTAC